MPTHAEMAAKLLKESAKFYRAVGSDNPNLQESMESMASACDHIDHVRTQLPYALIAAGIAATGFLLLGLT